MTIDFLLIGTDRGSTGGCEIAKFKSATHVPRRKDISGVWFHTIFPVGEGAGYAGGIISTVSDGACAAQALARDELIPD